MFYLHEPINYIEIGEAATIHIDLTDKEFHCTCPGCGAEVVASAHDLCEKLVLTEDNESAYCLACSEKIRAERSVELEDDDYTVADMLIEELIDKTRDTMAHKTLFICATWELLSMSSTVKFPNCSTP